MLTGRVGAAGNLGVYLSSPLIGRIVDRKGPLPTLIFAAVALTSGYLLIRSFYLGGDDVSGPFSMFGVSGLALAEFAVGIGSTAGLSSAGNSVAKSYKKKRAAALSVVLSGFGLSALFYSTLSSIFLHSRSGAPDTTADFLSVLAAGCFVSMVIGIAFVRPVLHPSLSSPPAEPAALSVPENAAEVDIPEDASTVEPVEPSERAPLLRSSSTKSVEVRNVAGLALLRELDFYLIFLFNGMCAGIGLCYINNLGTVVRSLALYPPNYLPHLPPSPSQIALAQTRLVSLLSFCNFAGRLFSGFLSDYLVHHQSKRLKIPRVWWLVFTASCFTLSQVAANSVTKVEGVKGLILPTILTGFSHGSLFGLSGIIGLERFGMANFSSTNGILALAPALFGQTTNLIFGRIYDSHSHSPSPSSLLSDLFLIAPAAVCLEGRGCYSTAFRLTTGMGIAAIGVGVVLATVRNRMKVRAA
ncbi:hypothetical protein JCM11641_001380 [Rhodosporidiobolus odoratus]